MEEEDEDEEEDSCVIENQEEVLEASLLHNTGHYAGSSEELSKQCNLKDQISKVHREDSFTANFRSKTKHLSNGS